MIEMFGEVMKVISMSLNGRTLELRFPIPQKTKMLKRLVRAAKGRTPVGVAICWPVPGTYTPGYMGGPKLADPIEYKCVVKRLVLSCAAGERVDALMSLKNIAVGKNPWKSSGVPMKGERLRNFNLLKSHPFRVMTWCDADVQIPHWDGYVTEFELLYERGREKAKISVQPVRASPDGPTLGDRFKATILIGDFKDMVTASVGLCAAPSVRPPSGLHGDSGAGWLGVDLDGTLAEYNGWKGAEHIGPPVPRMMARVKGWLAEGREVRIVTARVHPSKSDASICRKAIDAWLLKHVGQPLAVTYEKDHRMEELWDDRAVQVVKNTGVRVDGKE
jgi:hypothetical protein